MCCCDKPTVNGEFGYKWQPNDAPGVRRPDAPELHEGQSLLYDEPGRCGGIDSHCHHYRLVKRDSGVFLLVRHGGGDESLRLSTTTSFLDTLNALDSTARYWLLNALYHAYSDGKRVGIDKTDDYWRTAAAEDRIKTRKLRGRNLVKGLCRTKNHAQRRLKISLRLGMIRSPGSKQQLHLSGDPYGKVSQ